MTKFYRPSHLQKGDTIIVDKIQKTIKEVQKFKTSTYYFNMVITTTDNQQFCYPDCINVDIIHDKKNRERIIYESPW